MSKTILLSRTFPAYHPKKGQPTFFVEKVMKSLYIIPEGARPHEGLEYLFDTLEYLVCDQKHHTIRAGKRWKDGDMASLRIWSGKPYNSKQIALAPDVKLTVKDAQMANGVMWIGGKKVSWGTVAENDGLTTEDLRWWFNKLPFSGQILIWNNNNLPY